MRYLNVLLLALIFSCNSPENKAQKEDMSDSEREVLLQQKKIRILNGSPTGSDTSTPAPLEIRFTPYVPGYPDLGEDGIRLIETRLSNLIAKYGVASRASDPSFALIPSINILTSNITATAPVMFANTYEITLFTTNMLDGSVFSSESFTVKGVGPSPLKAFINALQSADIENKKLYQLLKDGQDKALQYYATNCDKIINQAKNEASLKNYDNAFLILKMIPSSVKCYAASSVLLQEVFQKKMAADCGSLVTQMKAELGKESDIGGFNEKAMSYYALIGKDAPCYTEAQKIYDSYTKKLNPQAKIKWQQDEREFNLRKDKQEQDNTFALTKADLEAKVAIEGQTDLLNKYKKDHEYNKLPWLRKLVHLGEWDPFDATSKINSK